MRRWEDLAAPQAAAVAQNLARHGPQRSLSLPQANDDRPPSRLVKSECSAERAATRRHRHAIVPVKTVKARLASTSHARRRSRPPFFFNQMVGSPVSGLGRHVLAQQTGGHRGREHERQQKYEAKDSHTRGSRKIRHRIRAGGLAAPAAFQLNSFALALHLSGRFDSQPRYFARRELPRRTPRARRKSPSRPRARRLPLPPPEAPSPD